MSNIRSNLRMFYPSGSLDKAETPVLVSDDRVPIPRNSLICLSLKLYFKRLGFSTSLWKTLWKTSAAERKTHSEQDLAPFLLTRKSFRLPSAMYGYKPRYASI